MRITNTLWRHRRWTLFCSHSGVRLVLLLSSIPLHARVLRLIYTPAAIKLTLLYSVTVSRVNVQRSSSGIQLSKISFFEIMVAFDFKFTRRELLGVLSSFGVSIPPTSKLPDERLHKRLRQAINASQAISLINPKPPLSLNML
ncbi:hypothetical protein BC835DRAFT_873182 [Cytidiella melzeri]|nr:hypothetical protein BC835DRAFT_873182 [Cytidiella melzeri]